MPLYCDVEKIGSGTGTDINPYSFGDLVTTGKGRMSWPNPTVVTDDLYIKGSRSVDISSYGCTTLDLTSTHNLYRWESNKPWRIYITDSPTAISIGGAGGTVHDGIVAYDGDLTVGLTISAARNMICLFPNVVSSDCTFYNVWGSIIVVPGHAFRGGNPAILQDTWIHTSGFYGTLINASRCAFSCADDATPGTRTDCKFSWIPPVWPVWSAPASAWTYTILAAGIPSPPQPGTLPYTEYETDLWGNARTGIGNGYMGSFGTAPYVVDQPTNASVIAGATGMFQGSVTGSDTITNTWYHDGVTGASETGYNPTLFIPNAQDSDAGSYWFITSNSLGETASNQVSLTVDHTPYIDSQPANDTVLAGETGVFSGSATGTQPLWFNWYSYIGGTTGTFGETGTTLYIPNASTSDVGNYWFVAKNGTGSAESNHVSLTVNYPPYIVTQPENEQVLLGVTGSFDGEATGTQPIWFNWYKNIAGVTGVIGETGAIIYVPGLEANEGNYWYVTRNAFGSVESNHVSFTVNTEEQITQQPGSAYVFPGQGVTFSVTAVTDPSYSTLYQWKKDGSNIAGATGIATSIAHVQSSDLGGYMVRIANGPVTLDSITATLAFRGNPLQSPFSSIGMDGIGQDSPGGGSPVHDMGNANGDQVDNTEGDLGFDQDQGTQKMADGQQGRRFRYPDGPSSGQRY